MKMSTSYDRRMTRKTSTGFTLVELLVVIGIIALLLGILLPSLNRARQSAREVQCASNLRQWGIGYTMYVDSNKGKLPADGEDGDTAGGAIEGVPAGTGWESGAMWFNAIPPLLNGKSYNELQQAHIAGTQRLPINGDNSLFVCPLATTAVNRTSSPATNVNGDYFTVYGEIAGTATGRDTFICYVTNSKVTSGMPNGMVMAKLRPASEFVLMIEKRMRGGEVTTADDAYYQTQGGPAGRLTGRTLNRVKGDWQRFTTRHRKERGGNLLFADGHVSFFTHKEVTTRGSVGVMNQPGKLKWSVDDLQAAP